jgi:hypothetical protein
MKRRLIVRGTFAALALLLSSCSQSPAGIVLVFQSDADRMNAASAEVFIIKAAGGDMCSAYLISDPDQSLIEFNMTVGLNNGVPSRSLSRVPTGTETVFVKVLNGMNNIFLHGCKTGNLSSGATFEVNVVPLGAPPMPDMTVEQDSGGPIDDLSVPPPDMAVHHQLTINVPELRSASRKLVGVSVNLADAMGGTASATTDATGAVKFDITGMTAPYTITANAPPANGFQGSVTLLGVTPSFAASNSVTMNMPVELDPPSPSPSPASVMTVTGLPSGNYTMYNTGTNALPTDLPFISTATTSTQVMSPALVGGISYRVAVTVGNPITSLTTQPAVTPIGTYNNFPALASFSQTLTPTTATNAAYTTQQYAVKLVLAAAPNQAPIPIFGPTTNTAGAHAAIAVPPPNGAIPNNTFMVIEETADSPTAHAELREQLNLVASNSSVTLPAVADQPTVMVSPSPSPVPSTDTFTVTATPPSGFLFTSAFVHITIHDVGNLLHWHVIAPAANPTSITLPASLLPVGTYNVDVAFVIAFTLSDGTVAATLADDYTKLIRQLPKQLNQATLSLTVN